MNRFIRLISLAIMLCLALSFAACTSEGSGDASVASEASKVEYTVGTIENNYYVNEWADIKFRLVTPWKACAKSDYAVYESATTDCGLLAGDATRGQQLAIVFEENPSKLIDEKKYLDNFVQGLKSTAPDFICGEYFTKTIAGKEFLGVRSVYARGRVSVYQFEYVRLHDGKFISIIVTASDENTAIKAVESFTSAN